MDRLILSRERAEIEKEQKEKTYQQQRDQSDTDDDAGDNEGQAQSVLSFVFFHRFLTALYPSPRTDTISNSVQPSKRFLSRPM